MSRTRTVLLVVGCVVCLLAVASALPAADPRLDAPGADGEREGVAGDWDEIAATPEPIDEVDDEDGDPDHEGDPELEIRGDPEPGSTVSVGVEDMTPFEETAIRVDGERVGVIDGFESIDVTVPYEESFTVEAPDEGLSRTVDVRTDATVRTHGGAAPTGTVELAAAVGSTPVADATVYRDGEAVATTDEEGNAEVELPPTARPTEFRVERGAVAADHTVEVAEPSARFVSPLLFPGSPAPVQVSADGAAVENATVAVEGDDPPVGATEATTGGDGRATVWLPLADEAAVTVTVGEETARAEVGSLYLRLTAVVVLAPGLLIGATYSYLRYTAARERRRGAALSGLFVGLAAAFDGLFDGLRWPGLPSLSALRVPSPDLSGLFGGLGAGLRGLGSGLGSLAGTLGSIGGALGALASLGSLSRSGGTSGGSLLDRLSGSDDGGDGDAGGTDGDGHAPSLAAEPLGPRGPRTEIREAWHAFLDRIGVRNRETVTPGQVARHAVAAGFPAATVRRLVETFRAVEYGGRDPSPDRVAEARAAAEELTDHDPEGDEDA